MKSSFSIRAIAAGMSLAALSACGSEPADDAATLTSDAPPVIEERQANFEGISDAFKVIRTQLEGEAPDFAVIEAQATDINARAQLVNTYFPEGTSVDDGHDTEALAKIWEEPAKFEEAAQNFVAASETMVTLAGEGDAAAIGAQVGQLGGTCKACHDQFRLKTD
ncbi:MAG: cytochrome c [Erythrobacter sp.]